MTASWRLRAGASLEGDAFAAWLDLQGDLSPKWHPTYLRVVADLERSETNKVQKRALQREKFMPADPGTVLWRARGAPAYRPLTADDLNALRTRFARAGNLARW